MQVTITLSPSSPALIPGPSPRSTGEKGARIHSDVRNSWTTKKRIWNQRHEESKNTTLVRGVRDLIVEQQTLIPQIKIEYDRERLQAVGLTVEVLNRLIETVMNGQIVSEVMQGQPTFDLVVRLKDDAQRTIDRKMESFE